MYSAMNKSAYLMVILAFCFLAAVDAQQPVQESKLTSQGIALYEQGDTDVAIKTLREAVKASKDDAKAWHYLGLALTSQRNLKEAREAFLKAISLRSKSLAAFDHQNELRDDQISSFKALLGEQIESQTRLLEAVTDKKVLENEQSTLERLKIRADCVEQTAKLVDGHSVLTKSDMKEERPRVLFKPEPAFTDSARQAGFNGFNQTVILRATFAADGSVRNIKPIKSLGYGLTEEAIRVAKLIRFQPGTMCGKAVGFPIQLEYSFMIGVQ